MLKFILLSILLVAVNCQLPNEALGQVLRQPEQLTSVDGLLTVELTIDIWDVYFGAWSIKRRLFNGQMPGPTLRVFPGDVVVVTLVNNLEPTDDGRNTANFQVHGLHIAPLQTSESNPLMNEVIPGESFTYIFTIDPDQQAGSFLYSSDIPVKTDYQLAGGMAGMFVVTDPCIHPQLDIFSCPENCQDEIGLIFQPSLLFQKYPERYDDLNGDDSLQQWSNIDYFTVNGQVLPTINIEWNQIKMLRLLNAGGSDVLEIDTPCSDNGYCCDVKIIAADGVLFDKPQEPRNGQTFLAPGQSIDWLMWCKEPGYYDLKSAPLGDNNVSRSGEYCFRGRLATIIVEAGPDVQQRKQLPITFTKREDNIGDLVYIKEEDITGRTVVDVNPKLFSNTPRRNGNSPAVIDIWRNIEVEGIEEWTILNSDPFDFNTLYMPINHMQIINYNHYYGPINIWVNGKSTLLSQNLTKCQVQYPGYDSSSLDLESYAFPNDILSGLDQRWRYRHNEGAIGMADIGEWKSVLAVPPLANITIRFVPHSITAMFGFHSSQNKEKDLDVLYLGHIGPRGYVPPQATDPFQFVVTNMGTCMDGDFYPEQPKPKEVMTPFLSKLSELFQESPAYEEFVKQRLSSYFGEYHG